MGVNGIGGNRFNTWNFNDLMNGTATRNASQKKKTSGGVSLYAGNNAALSAGPLGQDQTKAFSVNYSRAYLSAQQRADEAKKAQQTGKKDPDYNHKKFTNKMKNAKRSQQMTSVLADIRATIADLKAKQATGEYDEEEIAAAILHAELMEAVAMKRMENLETEEMAERKVKREELEELMEGEEEEDGPLAVLSAEDAAAMQEEQETEETLDAEMKAMQEEMQRIQQAMAEQLQAEMEEMTEELTEEDPLQALDDMAKVLGAAATTEEDVDEMKKKHRAAEDMAATRADMEFLKMKFDRLQRQRDALKSGAAGMNGSSRNTASATGFADGAKIVAGAVKSAQINTALRASNMAAPAVSSSPAPEAGGSIDVSG